MDKAFVLITSERLGRVAARGWTGIGEGVVGMGRMGHGGPSCVFGVESDRAPLNRSIAFRDGCVMTTIERKKCYVFVVSISQTPSSAVAGQSNSAGNGRGRQLED